MGTQANPHMRFGIGVRQKPTQEGDVATSLGSHVRLILFLPDKLLLTLRCPAAVPFLWETASAPQNNVLCRQDLACCLIQEERL